MDSKKSELKTLSLHRKKIDTLDLKILRLLVDRAKSAQKIGEIKKKQNQPIYSKKREQSILEQLLTKKNAPLSSESVESIFMEIIQACRNVQEKLHVAYLGPQATFTHQVAVKHFGQVTEMVPERSIGDIFAEVERGRADYGVVPIENSTEGVVNHTLDMFMESDLKIYAEREEPISHSVLSVSGKLSTIKHLYSHPQALAQCRKWIESHLPHAEIHQAASTADAALQASLDKTVAAIASPLAAKIYNLRTVAIGVQDVVENVTRFLIISKQNALPSKNDKTSILLSIKDKVGALNELLLIFKRHKINLTKIESRPTKKKVWEYVFYVDFVGNAKQPRIQSALKSLQKYCLSIKILGSYPSF